MNTNKTLYIVREIPAAIKDKDTLHVYMESSLEAAKSKLIELASSKGADYTINETGTKASVEVGGKTTTYFIEQLADKKFEEVS